MGKVKVGLLFSLSEPKADKVSLEYTNGPLSVVRSHFHKTSQKPLNRLKSDFILNIYASREQKFI